MVRTYGELYRQVRHALEEEEGENAAFAARELLHFVTGRDQATLMAMQGLFAPEEVAERYLELAERMLAGEPLAYILGQWSFYGLNLTVNPDVLIPRDDTMAVVDLVLERRERLPATPRILDLCTGSGCIGLALASQIKGARVTLADLSPAALKIAKKNTVDLRLTARVSCLTADATKPASRFLGQFDVVISNPPYVTRQEMEALPRSVKNFEPAMALFGGEDGLDFLSRHRPEFYRRHQARRLPRPGIRPGTGGRRVLDSGGVGLRNFEAAAGRGRNHPRRPGTEEGARLIWRRRNPAWIRRPPASDKKKALETAIAQIEKNFGKGTVMRLGDKPEMQVDAIPTGSLALDAALGIGGVPKGRIIEIYGPESSGKTTLALHIVAQAQKRGGEVAFVDAEHALDPDYAAAIGVDIDNMLVSQPDTGEQALEITDALVRSGAVDVVVVDSVAALTPRQEIEGEMGDTFVGLQARLMSQALRKLAGSIAKTNCVVIFINQLRMKIGVMYGNPETTTGGNALKFYASVRIDIRRIEAIKNGSEIVGNRTRAKIVKNKVAPPFKEAVVRHHVRRGHLQVGRAHRPGRAAGHHPEERQLVLHGRRAHRPGTRQRQGVSHEQPRNR